MAVGDIINYTNYKSTYSEAWRNTDEYSGGSFPYVICISAPSFIIKSKVNTSGIFASIKITITAYYFNGTGDGSEDSHWTRAWTSVASTSGLSGSSTDMKYHNRSAEGSQFSDNHYVHLWKLVVTRSTGGSNYSNKVSIWAGGIEMMTSNEYDNYCKFDEDGNPNLIKYSEGIFQKMTNTGSSIASFVASNRPSHFRGTPIKISSGTANKICATSIN